MPGETGTTGAHPYSTSESLHYPLTKMNFLVTVGSLDESQAAFSEITGVEASVDVIEFRQGNAHTLSPVKLPGLVKHGNVTLKMGYTVGNGIKEWIIDCVNEKRDQIMPRYDVNIELIDINGGMPGTSRFDSSVAGNKIWTLKNAWVTKYTAPDLNSMQSEVAIESLELAYEELVIPN